MSNPGDDSQQQPQVIIDPAHMAGVWSNFAKVSHSPYEFTIDFARLDFSGSPPQGIVVARVSLSPLMVSQLIDALSSNWQAYASKSMPPEARDNEPGRNDDEQ
jgi:hypothetical protein